MTAPAPQIDAATRAGIEAVQRASIAAWCATQKPPITVDGDVLSFRDYPFIPRLLDDPHPDIVIKKGAQLGFTVAAILKMILTMSSRKLRGGMYVFPTRADAADFSKSRFSRMLRENERLNSLVQDTDAVGLKQIGGAFAYFRGSNSATGLKSVPVDLLIFDERSEMAQEMVTLADHRLDGSKDPQRLEFSTPVLPETDVCARFDDSDQHRWMIRCGHCSEWTCLELTWPDCWQFSREQDRWYRACVKCGGEIFPHDGEWVATYPDRGLRRGYHVSQLNSPRRSPGQIHQNWTEAQAGGELAEFHRSVLGEGYAEIDQMLTEQLLEACVDEARPRQTADLGPCALGVDVGPRDFHWVVGPRTGPDTGDVLAYGVSETPGELLEVFDRFACSVAVIDAMAETRAVRELIDARPGRVWGNFYVQGKRQEATWTPKDMTVSVGRTETLDASHRAVVQRRVGFPRRDGRWGGFAKQMMNLARTSEVDAKSGGVKTSWVVRGTKNDHYRHAFNYWMIALGQAPQSEKVQRGVRRMTRGVRRRRPSWAAR